jgi:hypothetical protein
MQEREVIREPVREREIIVDRPAEQPAVVDDRPRRGGGGAVAAIVGVLLLVLIGWFLLQALGIMGDAAEDAEVNVPEEVNVDAEG